MFGPKQVRVATAAEQELENRVSREGEVEQGNGTLKPLWRLVELDTVEI